jgi:hypothetical protein
VKLGAAVQNTRETREVGMAILAQLVVHSYTI